MNKNKSSDHVTALDGVRGAAVLMVMLYHFAHVPHVSHSTIDSWFYRVSMTGWIGVDIFFALSGFLITGLLLQAKNSSNYFVTFYGRRALRIFPLYYIYIIVLFAILYPAIADRVNGEEHIKLEAAVSSWPWFVLYVSNIKQATTGMFFGAGAGHLWSLAIEEQFYLVWPLVVLLTSEFTLTIFCCALLILALALRFYMAAHSISPEIIYVFTPARIDGLVCGALAAVVSRKRRLPSGDRPMYPAAISLVGFCIALISLGSRAESSPLIFTAGFSILAIICGFLVYAASKNTGTLLNSRVLVFFGKYSYALYIFHPAVRIIALKVFGSPKTLGGSQIPWQIVFSGTCLLVSIGIAILSWNLFEKHFVAIKDKLFPQQRSRSISAVAGYKATTHTE